MRIYLAAPLFSGAELAFNVHLARRLEQYAEVYLPQRDGLLYSKHISTAEQRASARRVLFEKDCEAIIRSDVIVAVLDGRSVDEGVAFELGLAFARQITCVGLQTDPRRLMGGENNPMIAESLIASFESSDDLLQWVQEYSTPLLWGQPTARALTAHVMSPSTA